MNITPPKIQEIVNELDFSTSRSSGPGGQNVNKVNSKVTLKWNVVHSAIDENQRDLILRKLHARLTKEGVLLLVSQEKRSQIQNKEAAIQKLQQLLSKAFAPKKVRRPTKPGKASKQVRLNEKKLHAEKKKWRQKPE